MKLDQRTLRAIGQDLEHRGVFDFDLELDGKKCVLRARTDSSQSGGRASGRKSKAGPSTRGSGDEERTYCSADIDRIVEKSRSHRREGKESDAPRQSPPLDSTAEILRVLAGYCEIAELNLVRLSKRGQRLEYDYVSESGTRRVERRHFSDLEDFARGMMSQRQAQGS